jgi:serine/threonine protein kinase
VFDSEQSAIPSLATLILKSTPGKSVLARLDGNDLASAQTRPNPAQSSQPEAVCWRGEVGGTISHYRITEKIGEGGMGAVYKAEDTRLDRTVALKFLNQSAITSDEQKERLVLEAKAAAALNHPNVCTVHEICEAAGQMCIVMEYIEGESLRQKIKRSPLNLDEALDLAIGIGEGLKAVHRKRIIHRDVKSANIMVMPEGRPKIMDFGLAFLGDRSPAAMTGTSYGTPAYMSPEQVRGETVTARADIWALGVIVYEMISGVLPFHGQNAQALLNSILSDEPTPLSESRCGLPLELERIVDKALAKKAADRYQHMGEMVRDLEGLRKNAHVGVRPRRSEPREFGAVRWTAM